MTIEVIRARPFHCGQMARIIRREHKECVERTGADVHRLLRQAYDGSCYRKSLLIDGQLAMMGGISSSELSPHGIVWLAMSEAATRRPIAMIKVMRQQLEEVMVMKRELHTLVMGDDEAAKRLAIFMGFHVSDEGLGRAAYSRSSRRSLARHIETNADVRHPMGSSFGVVMGYHEEPTPCA